MERFALAARRAGVRAENPAVRERFLLFRVGDEVYGMGLGGLQEVLPPEGVTILPAPPVQVCVSLAHRGRRIPAIRMRLLFGSAAAAVPGTARLLVARAADRTFGLFVDEVLEVVEVDASQIASLPALATRLDPACFRGVLTHQGRAVVLVKEDGLGGLDEVVWMEESGD